jgi:hypothetical protein
LQIIGKCVFLQCDRIQVKVSKVHFAFYKIENVAKIGNNWQQLTDFQTFSGYFHVFQVVEHIPDSFTLITFKNEAFEKKSKISFLANFSYNL